MTDTPKSSPRDRLTVTTKEGEIELTEQELTRVAGGLKISLSHVEITNHQIGASSALKSS